MSESDEPTQEEIEQLYSRLAKDAKQGGYNLNPDVDFVKGLVKGLIVNTQRYGYQACPCRLAEGDKALDLDIICPCDYRDADITDFGACYCALYVSNAVLKGEEELRSIPERRPSLEERQRLQARKQASGAEAGLPGQKLSYPVWRCVVCGYLCGREAPPEICPICKAGKERFERFI
ncbi:ferredoxin-thioredoxin reductase catalytic domain-containing protein [Methanothrix sp.]|uniref:ferredoxin-thioredoxin reductase catalytic domain-containing protein n=1 Tax=Methanothrix sp. TaxID=90426 RepID=UPI003C7662D9